MKNLKSIFLILLTVSIILSTKTSIEAQNEKAVNSISVEEFKNHMYFLASDFLGGRVSYQKGYTIAAEYCVSQFKSIGLEPGAFDSDGKPSFFQEVPLVKKTYKGDCSINLMKKGETILLENFSDFKMPQRNVKFPEGELEIVFIGYGIEEPDHNWNDFKDVDIKGKAVILLSGSPTYYGKAILPKEVHAKYNTNSKDQFKFSNIVRKQPAAIFIVTNQALLKEIPWGIIPTFKGNEQYNYENDNQAYLLPPFYIIKEETLPKFFDDQVYSPEHIGEKGLEAYKSFVLKGIKMKSNLKLMSQETIICKNIVAKLSGTDDLLKKEYVLYGAHLDHLLPNNGEICNGADDNASGSIGVLELAEAMTINPPKRSALFILFTAEEMGLIGSKHFVNNSPVPLKDIVFYMNFDMIGRSTDANMSSKMHNVVIHKEHYSKVKEFVTDINKTSINFPLYFLYKHDMPGGSDNTSFNDKGIPSLSFFSGYHKDLHQPTDDADKIDYLKMKNIIHLSYILSHKIGNLKSSELLFSEAKK